MTDRLRDIPPLLHDARLTDCRLDPLLGTLGLSFRCLRRNADGTPIDDPTVDLRLGGVGRVVAYYSPAAVTVRPSEFEPGFRVTPADLEDWGRGPVEAHLAIDSAQAAFDEQTACVRVALYGELDHHPGESALRVHLWFEPDDHGPGGTAAGLAVDCDTLEPFAGGVPLDVGAWEEEFGAWWDGWRSHWAAKGEGEAAEPAVEDTFIPLAPDDPPDLTYRPPAAAPFLVPDGSAPAELLRPIEDYHAGVHARDWPRAAAAYPHLDHEPDERAARLRDQYLGWDHGRWVYVRHVDSWWREGDRACVVARGVEHRMPDGESPARDEETVVTYGLRRLRGSWVIATWSQGWPRFGSADKLTEPQSWREGWDLPG